MRTTNARSSVALGASIRSCGFLVVLFAVANAAIAQERDVKAIAAKAFAEGRIPGPPADHDFTRVPAGARFREGELLVRFAPGPNGAERSQAEKGQLAGQLGGASIVRTYDIVPGLALVKLGPGSTVEQALGTFNASGGVLYAEPNYEREPLTTPTDPSYLSQWALNNTGQTGGTADADIDAPEAWDILTGTRDVIVAVIDTGVDYNHPDLAANMWVNVAELAGNGLDDDGNGYVDDIHGYDFFNDDPDPMDDNLHGTHVAGIIGAAGNNSVGVSGVAWTVRIMALKIFPCCSGAEVDSFAIAALEYATAKGARVSNNSWGGYGFNQSLKDAIDVAGQAGMVFVAAAGNDINNNDVTPLYPSSYTSASIISVLATTHNDGLSSFSSYGATSVDLGAPGGEGETLNDPRDILSTFPVNLTAPIAINHLSTSYETIAGTSMATPQVAGACALVLAVNPASTVAGVKSTVLSTVDTKPALSGKCVTGGRLNLRSALNQARPSKGIVRIEKNLHACGSALNITVIDKDIAAQTSIVVTFLTALFEQEQLTLTQPQPNIGVFTGSINTVQGPINWFNGIISVQNGDIVTVTYNDANDGTGQAATATDTTTMDCVLPSITNVVFDSTPDGPDVTINFTTSEPSLPTVRSGASCGSHPVVVAGKSLATSHSVKFTGYAPSATNFFVIEATDRAGNTATNNNGGACFSLTGDAGPRDMLVPSQFATIQAAIDVAWNGGRVVIANGTFTGAGNRDMDFKGKAITVTSANGAQNCIIDCQASVANHHRAFNFTNRETPASVVKGLTIKNGYTLEGGAIFCELSSPTIENCVLTLNHAAGPGGALYSRSGSPVVKGTTFSSNSADYSNSGGGALLEWGGTPRITNCTFQSNSSFNGGGLFNGEGTTSRVEGCAFRQNTVSMEGGGAANAYTDVTYISCSFTGNTGVAGGGMSNVISANPILINCTFTGNSATTGEGGGLRNSLISGATATNSIFWGNTAGHVGREEIFTNNTMVMNYCDIQGGFNGTRMEGPATGANNIAVDPLFVTTDHLNTGSPCINAGDPDGYYGGFIDIDGKARVVGGRVDIGADEFSGVYNYANGVWYTSIQTAINAAATVNGTVIEVGPGTYTGAVNFNGKTITLRGSVPTDPAVVASTVVNGGGAARVIQLVGGEGPTAAIKGLTLTGGQFGIYCATTSPLISHCVAHSLTNTGIYCSVSSAVITNCTTRNNTTQGIFLGTSSATVKNCWSHNNLYGIRHSTSSATSRIVNSTIADNTSRGIYSTGNPTVKSCIIWNNVDDLNGTTATYSCIEDGDAGTGNISSNPLFVDAALGNYRIKATSPCINAGDPNYTVDGNETDVDRGPRLVMGRVDMGADEQVSSVLHVDPDGPEGGDGSSWENAIADLQEALSAASSGTAILVATGFHTPAASGAARTSTFTLKDGVALVGGFAGLSGIDAYQRDAAALATTLSGDLNMNDGPGFTNTSDNSYHVVSAASTITNAAVLDGFVVRDGSADGSPAFGAGLYSTGGSPVVLNCNFTDNKATQQGGGVYLGTSSPLGTAKFINCSFVSNSNGSSGSLGGGLMVESNNDPWVANCKFILNSAGRGGGVYNLGSGDYINCLFSRNSSLDDGGGMLNSNATPVLRNSSFSGNNTQDRGGGIYNQSGSNPVLKNCILWGNTATNGTLETKQFDANGGSYTVSYCCIQGLSSIVGTSNIGTDPLFVNAGADDLHLQTGSPSISTGSNAEVGLDVELDGKPRILGTTNTVDRGSYEK